MREAVQHCGAVDSDELIRQQEHAE